MCAVYEGSRVTGQPPQQADSLLQLEHTQDSTFVNSLCEVLGPIARQAWVQGALLRDWHVPTHW